MQRPQHSQPPAGDQVDTRDGIVHRKFSTNNDILLKGVDPREAGQGRCQPETRPSQRATESGPQGENIKNCFYTMIFQYTLHCTNFRSRSERRCHSRRPATKNTPSSTTRSTRPSKRTVAGAAAKVAILSRGRCQPAAIRASVSTVGGSSISPFLHERIRCRYRLLPHFVYNKLNSMS